MGREIRRVPPDPDYHRPDFGDTATHYQMYETVSEGTPVSPVFATLGWAPSMMSCNGKIAVGVEVHEPGFCPEQKGEEG